MYFGTTAFLETAGVKPLELAPKYKSLKFVKNIAFNSTSEIVLNPIVTIPDYPHYLRGRSEMVIIKGNKMYLNTKKQGLCSIFQDNPFMYTVPGGGWEPNEPHNISAKREVEEEALIKTKNIRRAGSYVVFFDEPKPWVKTKVEPKYWWYGYYTEVYVADFDGIFTGEVGELDKDDDMVKDGKFTVVSSIYNQLNPVHQRAIDMCKIKV